MITSHLSSRTQQNNHPQGQPGKRLSSFSADRPIEAPKAGLKKIPKPTIMELISKRPGVSAAPTTRTPGSFPPPCRDPFRWAWLSALTRNRWAAACRLPWAGNTANRSKGLILFIVLCYTFLKKDDKSGFEDK